MLPFEVTLARDPLGQEVGRQLPGGVGIQWSRDRLGRPREQRVTTGAHYDTPGREIVRTGYKWRGADQIEALIASGVVTQGQ